MIDLLSELTAVSLEHAAVEKKVINIEFISKMAHNTNCYFSELMGDPDQRNWAEATDEQRESSIAGVMAVLSNPEVGAAEIHEAWRSRKEAEGWTCGPTKDETTKQHPCMLPYDELSLEHRAKDHLFVGIVKAFIGVIRENSETMGYVVSEECNCGNGGIGNAAVPRTTEPTLSGGAGAQSVVNGSSVG